MILSIIIATRGRPAQLQKCIDSINMVYSGTEKDLEIIIVDQSVERFDVSSRLPIKHLYSMPGASKARNLGANSASGKYLWFFDDDATLKSIDLGALKTNKTVYFVNWQERNTRSFINQLSKTLFILRNSGTPMYIIQSEKFQLVGGFDDRIGPGCAIAGGEDADFILRCEIEKEFDVNTIGEFSHPIENQGSEKLVCYAKYRGFILYKNKLYLLIALHIFYYAIMSIIHGRQYLVPFLTGLTKKMPRGLSEH